MTAATALDEAPSATADSPLTGYRPNVLWATLTIGTAFTWLSAWLTGLIIDPGTWPIRYTLLGVGVLVEVGFVAAWMTFLHREQRTAYKFFEALSQLRWEGTASTDRAPKLPVLAQGSQWQELAERMQAAQIDAGERVQAAEHARAALEVRCQRKRQELHQLRSIVNHLPEPVLAVDSFDEVVVANPSARQLLHLDGDVEHAALARLVHCEKLVEMLSDVRRRKTPTQRTGEVELSNERGQNQWYSVAVSGLSSAAADPSGTEDRPHGAVAVLRDISGHKAAQKRNAEFVSAVSHEMKTPLSGIKAYVELLADGDAEDDATREEFLNVINSQTDRLQRLIDNLLNLARIEAGVVNVSKQPRSLNELLEEAFHVVYPSAEAKHMQLVGDLSPMYLGVLADRDMLMQAAINLLSNAIKYTPEGGTVTLKSRLEGDYVVFEVTDTGVGLSEEDCVKVFEKFYRVRKDRKMAQGTGLGLPLAKHIVEDVHGGQLTVTSQLDVGSTFRVALPCAQRMSG